ncbi:MAG: helix-turn-helix domain-containing protein, partial [Thermoleophilaceae bacterium]
LSLEEIGPRVGRHPSTVAYWIKKHGLQAAHKERHAARGGIARERLAALIAEGHSLAAIARMVGLSVTAIRHWAAKYELETARSARIRQGREGRAAGLRVIRLTCLKHGQTDFLLEGRGNYRCQLCRVEAVARRRAKVHEALISEAGGSCALCGYDACDAALHFHHLDRSTKLFNVRGGNTPSLERLRAEAQKCVLLCGNCHAEVEAGVKVVPAKVFAAQDLRGDDDSPM